MTKILFSLPGIFLFFIVNGQAPNIEWQKSFGGSSDDGAYSIQQTLDGGYIVAGFSESNDGDVIGNHGGGDCWIIKLNATGIFQWKNTFGGSGADGANSIQQTTDGGYIVAGSSDSTDVEISSRIILVSRLRNSRISHITLQSNSL